MADPAVQASISAIATDFDNNKLEMIGKEAGVPLVPSQPSSAE